jgi:hypothetical protein
MWYSLVKIQYTKLKLSCGNDPVVKNSIYSNSGLDLKINKVLPLPQGNHVARFGKDPIHRTPKHFTQIADNYPQVFIFFIIIFLGQLKD